MDWPLEHLTGSAEELHHRVLPPHRGVWVCRPDRPALVLGSSQDASTVDAEFCRTVGIDVVRRRSGGGGVYVHPAESLWVDVVIPRDDELWINDIGRSMWWLGDAWRVALADVGMENLAVHREAMVSNDWSRTLCFAGVGPGEVMCRTGDTSAGKVVGISQRRTREMARFQCIVYRSWDPALHARMMPRLGSDPDRIRDLVAPVDGIDHLELFGRRLG